MQRKKKEQQGEQEKENRRADREEQQSRQSRTPRLRIDRSIQTDLQPPTTTMSSPDGSGSSGAVTPPTPPLPQPRWLSMMPRPNQPDAIQFDSNKISDILEDWNIQCDDYGLTDAQKCTRFPLYCTPAIKDLVKLLPSYPTDWSKLEKSLKKTFWQHDQPKDTPEALTRLIKEAPTMDLKVYIIKFTAITDSLIAKHALSNLDRVGRLLDGLRPELRSRVLKFCAKKSWRLSSHDTGTANPDFNELKQYVLMEAQAAQKQIVYDTERAVREGGDLKTAFRTTPLTSMTSPTLVLATPTPDTQPNTAPDPITELTEQFSQLALLIQANIQGSKATSTPVPAPMPPTPNNRTPRCIYCDSIDHTRRSNCPDFADALRKGRVYLNTENRIVNAATGQEIPLMFGRGGMKKVFKEPPAIFVQNNNITAKPYGHLGDQSSVHITRINFHTGTHTD